MHKMSGVRVERVPIGNTDALEEAKKSLRLIRRSGTLTEIYGWVFLLSAIAGIWLFSAKLLVLIWFAACTLVGLLYLVCGRYIKDGFGRRTKLVLLVSSLISYPLSFALFPIYICLVLSNSYTRYKDLPRKVQELFIKPRVIKPNVLDGIFLGCFVIIGALSIAAQLHRIDVHIQTLRNAAVVHPAAQVNPTLKYHFTISFPGDVSPVDFTARIDNHDVPYTYFASTPGKNQGDYKIYAYSYPSPYFKYDTMAQKDLAAAVHKSVISTTQALQATLVSTTPSTFAGHTSEDAALAVTTFAGAKAGYMRVFFIGNYEYCLIAVGAPKDAFYSFAGTFQYHE